MTVITESFHIPQEIMNGIDEGLYRRWGGVVRYAVGEHKGEIVTMLKPAVTEQAEVLKEMAADLWEAVQEHKTVILVCAAAAAAFGSVMYFRHHLRTKRESDSIIACRLALSEYLHAMSRQQADAVVVEELLERIHKVDRHEDVLPLTEEQKGIIIHEVQRYVNRLAAGCGLPTAGEGTGVFLNDLESLLTVQKSALELQASA